MVQSLNQVCEFLVTTKTFWQGGREDWNWEVLLQGIVMLKDEVSPQSEVTFTLEQLFFKDLSVFGCIHPSLNSDQSPGPCC